MVDTVEVGQVVCLNISVDMFYLQKKALNDWLVFFVFTEVRLEQKSVPTAVFGGLKDD